MRVYNWRCSKQSKPIFLSPLCLPQKLTNPKLPQNLCCKSLWTERASLKNFNKEEKAPLHLISLTFSLEEHRACKATNSFLCKPTSGSRTRSKWFNSNKLNLQQSKRKCRRLRHVDLIWPKQSWYYCKSWVCLRLN